MTSISYSADQVQEVNNLKAYVEDWCQAQGIDPTPYLTDLDSQSVLQPSQLNDPVFQAYWKLTYLQLMEIINPMLIQSQVAEIGEVDFDTLYAAADEETNEFIKNLIMDNPNLAGFAALQDTDPNTTQQALDQILIQLLGQSEEGEIQTGEFVDQQARDLAEELGLGGMWDFLINNEEGIKSAENHLMEGLMEMDQQLAGLEDALRSGSMSTEEFDAEFGTITMYRELYVALIQNLEDAMTNMTQLFSNLIKSMQDAQMAIASNLRGAT